MLVIGVLLSIALGACQSPLDIATPRVERQLRFGITVRSITVSGRIMRSSDTTPIADWRGIESARVLAADTSAGAARLWLNCVMQQEPASATTGLAELHLAFDSIAAGDAVDLAGALVRPSATIVVDGRRYTTTPADNVSAVLDFGTDHGAAAAIGTVVIGMSRPPAFSALIVASITARND